MINNELIERILKFRDDRQWKQFHNPKDLAISICLEASELLEIFQWSGRDLNGTDKLTEIAEELADVVIYCVLMADATGLNIQEIMESKLDANEQKYTLEKAHGNSKKYTELE